MKELEKHLQIGLQRFLDLKKVLDSFHEEIEYSDDSINGFIQVNNNNNTVSTDTQHNMFAPIFVNISNIQVQCYENFIFQSIIPDFHSWAENVEPAGENGDKKLNSQNKHDNSPIKEQGAYF